MNKPSTNKPSKTYEMLWDCDYCNTPKLLGKSHRFCPNCGAIQAANKRYYPADDEKIAVEDHQFIGVDKQCPACETANAADATFCMQCGSALDGAVQVKSLKAELAGIKQQFDQSRQQQQVPQTPVKTKKSKMPWIIAGVVLLLLVIATLALWTDQQTLKLNQHQWSRSVAIENYAARSESAWCEQTPSQAYSVSRKQEVRSYRQIPDGEVCRTQRVDQGDGTYSEKQLCQPKYRKEPIYADKCYYQINRWAYARRVEASGKDLQPYWPRIQLKCQGQARLGCEREQQRTAHYNVVLLNPQGKTFSCEFPEPQWRQLTKNSTWTADIGMILKDIRCNSLKQLN